MGTAQIALTGKTMPTLNELNEIKSNLLSLGDEPGILEAKGETPVDIGPPETGLSDDLNALFDDFADVEDGIDLDSDSSVPDSSVPELAEGDGFADVEEEESVAEEIDSENSGIDDFEFNLEDDEPLFDMDGLDSSEPEDDAVPELAERAVPDTPVPELVEGDDFDFAEDEFSLDDNEPEIDDLDSDIDLSLDDNELDSSLPDSLAPELAEGDDFDLSGETFGLDDSVDSDVSETMDSELELGEDDELSLDLGEFEIDDSLDEDLDIDEFDLGDLGQDFGLLEDEISDVLLSETAVEESVPDEEELEEEVEISDDEFNRIKASLQILPGNLKLIIEEQIGEKGLKGVSLHKLINALADRKSPKEIAAITSRIIGRKIKIPASYAKKTGLDFEEEKGSFKYTLIHNILPLVKMFVVSLIILSAVGYLSFKFIYKPIYANILYNR
ncbi:MAG: hypothetical protein J7L71_02415, partial [Spirochaetaceae bacterium]|nr:hypothetical protein [Spirochaetaceae bacterium]